MTETKMHCFEAAGLGKAPFRYLGMQHQEIGYGQRVIGSAGGIPITTKPGGSCEYCGAYIVNMFTIESADGRRFVVGCECVRKTGDSGLIRLVDEDIKKAEREKRRAKKLAEVQSAKEYCEANLQTASGKLSELPHPSPWLAQEGKTEFDYVKWNIDQKNYKLAKRFISSALKG
jgi:hypothetical protein